MLYIHASFAIVTFHCIDTNLYSTTMYLLTYLFGLLGMCLLLLPYMCHISQHSNKGDLKAKTF